MSQDPYDAVQSRIRGLAYRMLGTFADADDVVQDTWLRWHAAGGTQIANTEAWLITAATRLCLDRLRSAARTRETYPGPWLPEPIVADPDPEDVAVLVESLTLGFLVLLDQLKPVERAVFVLADVFDVPFSEIATIVGRSDATCRQIASRARRRLKPDKPIHEGPSTDRKLMNGLLRAVATGDVNGVVVRLAPDVVCLTDGGPDRPAARRPVVGSERVARFLVKLAPRYQRMEVRPANVGGFVGAIFCAGKSIEQVMAIQSTDGVVTAIYFVGNRDKLSSVGCPPRIG